MVDVKYLKPAAKVLLISILSSIFPTFVSMKINLTENTLWKCLFFGLILCYCLFYAPFGVNETDGGFLTGLAWQVLNGKILYRDIIYVRPPLPVWMRALEIGSLPEQLGVIGERWIFYLKLGLYSWLAASLLYSDKSRWILATFGFVVSAHCYPAMAWHTVDGILFAVLAVFLFFKSKAGLQGVFFAGLSGIALFAALLCKQSFYPLAFILPLAFIIVKRREGLLSLAGLSLATGVFAAYLYRNNLLQAFLKMTNGSTDQGQGFEHAVLDYFRITPELALPSVVLLGLVLWLYRKNQWAEWPLRIWVLWLFALVFSFAAVTWMRQEHTAPFAQSRALFWVAVLMILQQLWQIKGFYSKLNNPKPVIALLLLSITWCAAISWGYSLPILFATPWVWAAMECTAQLQSKSGVYHPVLRLLLLSVLLLTFRLGFEFIYRDGKRSDMTENMGLIFPKLSGIYSDQETAARYRDLKLLAEKYGQVFTVLPAFPQAHYLTNTAPPLPLDWVVNRETNGDNELIFKNFGTKKPVVFFEKNYLSKLQTDPELSVSRSIFESTTLLEETPYFMIRR